MSNKVTTATEVELLKMVLREVRYAAATGEQLSIIIDPFVREPGMNVSFHYSGLGWSAELNGKIHKTRSARPRGGARR
jgi:hypothetical protein